MSTVTPPLAQEQFSLPRALLRTQSLLAALDQGGSLLKLLFVDKEDAQADGDTVTLRTFIYSSADLDVALEVITQRCAFPSDRASAVLQMTGVGYSKIRDRVESVLAVRTEFSDEFVCQARGAVCLVQHCLEDAFHPPPELGDLLGNVLAPLVNLKRQWNASALTAANPSAQTVLPANLLVLGSAPVAMHVDRNGMPTVLEICFIGGKTCLGLAAVLLGTSDYDEVMALAEQGDIRRCDLQVKDVFGEESDYGQYNPELAYMPFGKAFFGLAEEGQRREDIAASLVNSMSQVAYTVALHAAHVTGISRFYVSGNWARSATARRFLTQQWSLTVPDRLLEFKFLKSGVTTCLGALLNGVEQEEGMSLPK